MKVNLRESSFLRLSGGPWRKSVGAWEGVLGSGVAGASSQSMAVIIHAPEFEDFLKDVTHDMDSSVIVCRNLPSREQG